jgi:hypothetical protein
MPFERETVIINNLLVEKIAPKHSLGTIALIGCSLESILAALDQFNREYE